MQKRTTTTLLAMMAAFALTACEDIRVQEFPDGSVRMETTYVKDKKQGIEKEYYNNGTLKRETNYNEDRKEGVQKEYYDDGTLQAETPFADGYIEGEVMKYHKNGKLASKAKYQKNKQIEFGEVFDPDGSPATDGSYKDPRDGYAYQWIRIGTQLWTAENMNFGTYEGSVCNQCNHWGRLYNFENAKKACLEGLPRRLPHAHQGRMEDVAHLRRDKRQGRHRTQGRLRLGPHQGRRQRLRQRQG